jgi:tail protein (putative endopeptidase)
MPSAARVEIHDPSTQALLEILENATKVGYELGANIAGRCWFDLPRDDPKWSSVVAFREIWIYDELGILVPDIFRIMPFTERRSDDGVRGSVTGEGYATVLQDNIVPAEVVYTNQSVTTILTAILGYQTTARVSLGTIDSALNKTISMRLSFDNLMKAAWEVRNIVGGYISVDPQSGAPATRKLNLRAAPGQTIGQRVFKGFNLRELAKKSDPTQAVTKIYPLGRGEGANQVRPSTHKLTARPATLANAGVVGQRATLTLTDLYRRYKGWTAAGAALPDGSSASDTRSRPLKVFFGATDDTANWEQGSSERVVRSKTNNYTPPAGTPTVDYVHADYLVADDTVGTYGTIERPWTEKRLETSADLLSAAVNIIAVAKLPRVTYEVRVADLARVYTTESFERLNLYDTITVWDPDLGVSLVDRIVRVSYRDLEDPSSFEIVVSNLEPAPAPAQLADRMRKYEDMPDGATNIWVDSFEDNVDATHPYSRRIYIPADATVINKLTLNMETKAYRYYVSAAAAGADGSHSHSYKNFAANTGNPDVRTMTTDAAAESTHTHGMGATGNQNVLHTHTESGGGTTGTESANHTHTNAGTGAGSSHSHSHSHTADLHSHVTGAGGGTRFVIDDGSGLINNSSTHTHALTLTPGIVETTTPSSMEVKVDGTVASASATSLTDFDLTPYLSRDASGNIVRGWHTIMFTPNNNGRIQAAIVEQVFLQSRGVIAG